MRICVAVHSQQHFHFLSAGLCRGLQADAVEREMMAAALQDAAAFSGASIGEGPRGMEQLCAQARITALQGHALATPGTRSTSPPSPAVKPKRSRRKQRNRRTEGEDEDVAVSNAPVAAHASSSGAFCPFKQAFRPCGTLTEASPLLPGLPCPSRSLAP